MTGVQTCALPISALRISEKINSLLEKTPPWSTLSAPQMRSAKEKVCRHIYALFLPLWISSEIRKADEDLAHHVTRLSSFVTPSFIGAPAGVIAHKLFPEVTEALSRLDDHDSPMRKLLNLSDAVNTLNIILRECGEIPSADALVPCIVLAVARCSPALRTMHSTVLFIDAFFPPDEKLGELFSMFVHFSLAVSYLKSLSPGAAIVRMPIAAIDVPEPLSTRVNSAELEKVLKPIRLIVSKASEAEVRAKGAGLGATIGVAVASPVAIAVGVLTIGVGAPISACILAAGGTIGAACGAAIPLNVQKSKDEISRAVVIANEFLRPKAVTLITPFMTNRAGVASSPSSLRDVEFIVHTLTDPISSKSGGQTDTTTTAGAPAPPAS